MGGHKPNILSGANRDWLLERAGTDFTLRGLVAELAERGVKVDYVQVWRFVHAEGLLETARLRVLEDENRRLKKLLAESMLDV